MIPKIIHYCWFGGNPLPELAQKCIVSWKKFLPDYEIKEWNESNYDIRKIPYIAQAYDAKKYAFVSDYARFDILYQYGGVYFDTDVEMIKPLEEILKRGAFAGVECAGALNAGLGIASPAASEIFAEILDSYKTESFLNCDGSYNLKTVVERVSDIFRRYGFTNSLEIQDIAGFTIYPPEYFCPIDYYTHRLKITKNTYTIHHGAASWVDDFGKKYANVKISLRRSFGVRFGGFLALIWYAFANIKNIGLKKGLADICGYIRKKVIKKVQNKKIVIVSINGMKAAGGVERVVYYLQQILSEKYTVQILQAEHSLGKFNLIFYPLYFSLRLCFVRNKIVISQSWQSFLYPVDFSVHHGTTKGFTNQCPESLSFGSKMIAQMEKTSAHTAKKILAVSENCKNELVDLYNANERKIFVLNNFVNENQFFPKKQIFSIPKGKITLLFSGRLGNSKGLLELQALSVYLEQFNDIELHIACNDSCNTEIFVDKKNTKLYIGLSFEQMNEFYNSGDILIFPTKYEGFSMATLEALSCGLCVIGTRFAVMPELQKYEFCKVRETFEPESVIEDCRNLFVDWKNKKQEIHNRIIADFGTEQYAKKLLTLIEESQI